MVLLRNEISLVQFGNPDFFFPDTEDLIKYSWWFFLLKLGESVERVILFEAFLRPDLHYLQTLLHWVLGGGSGSSRPACLFGCVMWVLQKLARLNQTMPAYILTIRTKKSRMGVTLAFFHLGWEIPLSDKIAYHLHWLSSWEQWIEKKKLKKITISRKISF